MPTTARRADPVTRRTLADGVVVGSVELDGTHAWRGLPFAAPPVGPLRWRAPQPPARWDGEREALAHGGFAPQYGGLLAPVPPSQWNAVVGDEDCLTLNVFAPAFEPQAVPTGDARRPVMVWIHGGGLAAGTASLYDVARNHAQDHGHGGCIVVTINHRLGLLGFLSHPALAADPGLSSEERSGNFGLLDQIAALRWVRDHIAAFGGDPGRVTIFGESAGGQSVLLLLASPLAAGLFHRAIAQSPVAETFSMAQAVEPNDAPMEARRATGQEIAARLWVAAGRAADRTQAIDAIRAAAPADVADFLRALTPAQVLAAVRPGSVGIYLTPRPARDGVTLPLDPLKAVFASGAWNRVPVILGSNRDEVRTFLADKPEHSRLLFGKLPILHDRAAYAIESTYLSTAWRAMHVDEVADAMLAGGHRDVWSYRFDWDEAPAVPFIRPDLLLGAAHGMEMSFAFRDVAGEFDVFKVYTPFNRAGRQALAAAMGDAWSSFARDGAPSLPGGTAWGRRPAGDGADTLLFDSVRDGGIRMATLRTTMPALKQRLMTDREVSPPALRCRIYARMFLWSPLFEGHGSETEYRQWCERFACSEPAQAFRPVTEV